MKTVLKSKSQKRNMISTRVRNTNIILIIAMLAITLVAELSAADKMIVAVIMTPTAIACILAIYFTIRRGILIPLRGLTDSINKSGVKGITLYCNGVNDEIRELAREIHEVWKREIYVGERARLILDAMPQACAMFDIDCEIIECNREAIRVFGLNDKREYITRFFELSPKHQPDGQLSIDKAKKRIVETLQTGYCHFEWMHQLLDGTMMPSEITLVRIRYESGNIIAGFVQDMRKRENMLKEIEHRDVLLSTVNDALTCLLQAEQGQFESALLSSMGILAVAIGVDRMRLWKNQIEDDGKLYSNQLYEWSEGVQSPQGYQSSKKLAFEEELPGWEVRLSQGECINSLVSDLTLIEQKRFSVQGVLSILIVPIFLQDKFWGFVGYSDCHQGRLFSEMEESVLRSASLLIANTIIRNEMTQKLGAALEKAQTASRAKSSFLSTMSHEIRTPINAIVGMTIIGKTTSDLGKKDYAFEKIEIASSHLLGVINDVLDISKIEANRFELSNVEFNFETMLQKVVNVIVFRVNEKGQKFTVNLDKNIPHRLVGDDQRLAQVISNLLSNAVKFTPESGAIALQLSLIGEKEDKCIIQVEVTDTGIGISEEQQKRLFNSFEQAESSTSRKFGGTGLGLAISKQIVELMNGEIKIKSDLGKGSTFLFSAELTKSQHDNTMPVQTMLRDVRVLIVDDDQNTLEYFSEIVRRIGITCDTAAVGSEALKMLKEGRKYDICFVDWMMPGMDGIKLSREIKAAGVEHPVIIMISSYDWMTIEQTAVEAGINGFLPKPLFSSDIIDCINTHVGIKAISVPDNHKTELIESYRGRHILLAEDVEINREIVQSLLEPTQLEIDYAVNGSEAVRIFGDSPDKYDMIFMDVQMPEMDGLTATQLIRALDFVKAKEIPIVAMTANVFREDVKKCIEAGMNDHIGKPIDMVDMMGKLKKYLQPAK
ncbi:MAG: response regulator [Oscillospiraceae bacterium]|nr:response regulator [Oscillospiraceae bacterium]